VREHLTTNNGDPQMNLKKLFHKKTKTDTGIQNITKKQHNNDLHYIYTDKNQIKVMSYLDLLLKSLEQDNIDIIVDDEDLFNESILESRHNHYQKQCDMMGVINDKDPDSFYDLYSEWPLPDGRWGIKKFDGSERFNIQRKDKESVLELVDDLNNGRPFPFKVIQTDYSNKFGVGVDYKK